MAEGESNATSTQQQEGAGEAKNDAQNAADQKGAQGEGQQQTGTRQGSDGGGDGSGKQGSSDQPVGGNEAGSDTAKADAAATGEGKNKPVVPEKYDLKLSDGSLLDSSTVDKIAAIARERGLSNEDAQKHLAEIETQAMQERNERVTKWNESLKTDADFGGENYTANVQSVQRYAGFLEKQHPELLSVLESTGYVSHPAVAKYLRDMGSRMAEDKHTGKSLGNQEKAPERTADLLYGETTPAPKPASRSAA